LTPEEQAKV